MSKRRRNENRSGSSGNRSHNRSLTMELLAASSSAISRTQPYLQLVVACPCACRHGVAVQRAMYPCVGHQHAQRTWLSLLVLVLLSLLGRHSDNISCTTTDPAYVQWTLPQKRRISCCVTSGRPAALAHRRLLYG